MKEEAREGTPGRQWPSGGPTRDAETTLDTTRGAGADRWSMGP